MTAVAPRPRRAARPVTDVVVRRLEQLVLAELEPGAELPSESALAGEFGASRLTVREAVKTMQARGLLEVHRGRRPTVAYPNARPVGDFFASVIRRDPHQLLDLLEVRRALEVHIAALAASHAGRGSLAAMQAALDAMRQDPDDLDAVQAADLDFHESLAAASGNRLLSYLIEAMEEPLRASRLHSLRGHLSRGGTVDDLVDQHARILDRVTARDAKGASAAMRDHLAQTARDLRAAFTTALPGNDTEDNP
ncbi:MAG TPA: FadR/GntR family transcriptional regulator [Micromonosporaceae bacterium]|nr:FadR/GntR family transcriptional regulator [Micromonosporaceae bacterium]